MLASAGRRREVTRSAWHGARRGRAIRRNAAAPGLRHSGGPGKKPPRPIPKGISKGPMETPWGLFHANGEPALQGGNSADDAGDQKANAADPVSRNGQIRGLRVLVPPTPGQPPGAFRGEQVPDPQAQ